MEQPEGPKRPETAEEAAKREGLAQRAHDRSDRSGGALFPAVSSFAVEALKAPALVNGGSAAAMLAFIGTGRQPVTLDTIAGLKLFGCGLLVAMIATAVAYVAQYFYLREMQTLSQVWQHPFVLNTPTSTRYKRAAAAFHVVGVILVLIAYGCAVAGLWLVSNSLIPLPAKA